MVKDDRKVKLRKTCPICRRVVVYFLTPDEFLAKAEKVSFREWQKSGVCSDCQLKEATYVKRGI